MNTRLHPIIIIGISGGSGAGKTTIARSVRDVYNEEEMVYIPLDYYYKDWSHVPADKRDFINFDHPDALDTTLFIEHMDRLNNGLYINIPIYDFATHTRRDSFQRVSPLPIILVEGIHAFCNSQMRELFDLRVFIDTDPDIRLARRILRDVTERGRTVESIIDQWLQTVRPMHIEFIESNKQYADIVGASSIETTNQIISTISKRLKIRMN